MRFRLWDLVLFLLLFIFVSAFPVDLISNDLTVRLGIQIGLRCLVLVYYIYLIIRNRMKIFGIANIKYLLLCLPFILLGFSNILAALIDGAFLGSTSSPLFLSVYAVYMLVSVVSEEIVFRLFIHNALVNTTSTKRIFASAGIFALVHLINLAGDINLATIITVLEQVLYTFALGILLGLTYEYSRSLTGCFIIHFMFNFCNTFLVILLGAASTVVAYYLCAAGVALVVGVYAALIWIFVFKRPERYYRS